MNDTCGHEAGDSVLKRVAQDMKRLTGATIHGYRIGGDEFALIFCEVIDEIEQPPFSINVIAKGEKDSYDDVQAYIEKFFLSE